MLLSNAALDPLIPHFLRTCRNLFQFWEFIKYKFDTYAKRREYLWHEFNPLLSALERGLLAPADELVSEELEKFDASNLQAAWSKALERRASDPDGAITSARSLIESVCKHVLEEVGVEYDERAELPKLYKLTALSLNLAPSQHTEEVFRQILGGCTAVVEGLGSLRSRLGDAHGKGKVGVKPAPRHAELAVNLSGAMAMYLLATWEARSEVSA